jgi:hypothetical protein
VVSGTISVTPVASPGTTLKVVAGGTGYLDSSVTSNTYMTPSLTTPTLDPAIFTFLQPDVTSGVKEKR